MKISDLPYKSLRYKDINSTPVIILIQSETANQITEILLGVFGVRTEEIRVSQYQGHGRWKRIKRFWNAYSTVNHTLTSNLSGCRFLPETAQKSLWPAFQTDQIFWKTLSTSCCVEWPPDWVCRVRSWHICFRLILRSFGVLNHIIQPKFRQMRLQCEIRLKCRLQSTVKPVRWPVFTVFIPLISNWYRYTPVGIHFLFGGRLENSNANNGLRNQ